MKRSICRWATWQSARTTLLAALVCQACSASPESSRRARDSTSGEIWLGDFESPEELDQRWGSHNATAELTQTGTAHGQQAVRVSFRAADLATFGIEGWFERNEESGDWSEFSWLRFTLANLDAESRRVILQLKDANGHRYKRSFSLEAGERRDVTVDLVEVGERLDLRRVTQFQIFRWRPSKPAALLLDAVRVTGRQSGTSPTRGVPYAAAIADSELPPGDYRWLGDFESARELEQTWQADGVGLELAPVPLAHGRSAARVSFEPGGEDPGLLLERAFERQPRLRDWRGEEALVFSFFNAETDQVRLLMQLKDAAGGLYKESIYLSPKVREDVEVRLADVVPHLDLARMSQLKLFRWQPRSATTVYVDAIGLRRRVGPAPAGASDEVRMVPADAWQVTWAASLQKLFPEPANAVVHRPTPVQLSLARGERESVQLVLVGGRNPVRVRVSGADLRHDDGIHSIPADAIDLRRVAYVTTRRPYYPTQRVGSWPDPLVEAREIELETHRVSPMWITVSAAQEQAAGTYTGTLRLDGSDGVSIDVRLQVRVFGFSLPQTATLTTAFDLYRFRLEKGYRDYVPGAERWHGRMAELERAYFLDMLQHRVSPMVGAGPPGEDIAETIPPLVEHGLGRFAVGRRGGSNGNNWPRNPAKLADVARTYATASRSLSDLGLLSRAYVYAYDEPRPGLARVAEVLAALRAAAPELDRLLVMHTPPDPTRHGAWLADADIVCLRVTAWNPGLDRWLRDQGKEVWLYVSSPAPPYPSLEIDSPAMAARILPWMCWKYDIDGLLYWCVNFWRRNPWTDPATFASDQNGNGFLYYPGPDGPVPSIRLAVLRDGLEDYEYLHLLADIVQRARGNGVSPDLVADAERLLEIGPDIVASLRSYEKGPERLLTRRLMIARAIEQLQASLDEAS